jgi:hypothetical protein
MSLSGGCHCGAVRYEAQGTPFNSTLCHCLDCRRVSGAPAVAWFSVLSRDLRWSGREPAFYQSSAGVTRSFCPSCGSTLSFQDARWQDEIDITTCSLDDPESVPPKDHTFVRSRLGWMMLHDGLPQYPTTRSAGKG